MENGSTLQHAILGDLEVPGGEDTQAFVEKKLATLRRALVRQFSHYFSDANFKKDTFLQSQADLEGWVSLRMVSNFNRMQALGKDHVFILQWAHECDCIDVSECGQFIRQTQADP